MLKVDEQTEALVRDLPDAAGARLFFERISAEHPQAARTLKRDAGLLSDALALAAWSPLLATTLAQNPDYLHWLARERLNPRVKTREELGESLARFGLTHSQLDPQILLARFRRRELLRIYLRDIRRISTLVETTEELSNLADAILEHALNLAHQELDNRYGQPLRTDERGRTASATFCVLALGKLGSYELNYASDIDLIFLYSDDGMTSGKGTRGQTTNREYFVRLAEMVARIVGQPSGEGAAYRVDLRLRPHGRDGMLASSLDEAVRYYLHAAQAWELQTLIRSRAAAGDSALYARFIERVLKRVYRPDETIRRALGNVRLAKQKIDSHHAHDSVRGYNVKLGRGGIREIEFIAQALQLSHAGRDDWLRASHTLISLGRLAERRLITERERAEAFDAYLFLRTLEHRLQMEHGLQTHSVPEDRARRALVARRMGYVGEDALERFDRDLALHTANVRTAYERVFENVLEQEPSDEVSEKEIKQKTGASVRALIEEPTDALRTAANSAAHIFAQRLSDSSAEKESAQVERVVGRLNDAAHRSLNPRRALTLTARVASSLDKSTAHLELTEERLDALVAFCGASEFFGEMIASNPSLIEILPVEKAQGSTPDYDELLRRAVEGEETFGSELGVLRRTWAGLIIEIAAQEERGAIDMRESNRRQTLLATASLNAGCLIAKRELARRYGHLSRAPVHLAVLGLGKLGGGGVDYGSDLDVVLIYDDDAPSPIASLNHSEAYARFSELLVSALSSMTREGALYRVDLRLRPDGRNGATAPSARAFLDYLKERADIWEWLAYVKLRAAAGDMDLGRRIEAEARRIIHEAARRADAQALGTETRRVRQRLEREKTLRKGSRTTDIKYGQGGMLDVYFAARYLQLRDSVPDGSEDRSTHGTLERLRESGSLKEKDFAALDEGYALLRTLDHHLRFTIGRSTRLPAQDHEALKEIAVKMGYPSTEQLLEELYAHMRSIHDAYNRITSDGDEHS